MPKSQPDKSSQRLPFEPKKVKPKLTKQPVSPLAAVTGAEKSVAKSSSSGKATAKKRESSGIPEVVSRRMASRMLVFCGLPSLMGLLSFPLSYYAVTQKIVELPNAFVVVVSLALMLIGALGLSYGVLSASWEEADPGTWLGWQEFRVNLGRMQENWRNRKQAKSP